MPTLASSARALEVAKRGLGVAHGELGEAEIEQRFARAAIDRCAPGELAEARRGRVLSRGDPDGRGDPGAHGGGEAPRHEHAERDEGRAPSREGETDTGAAPRQRAERESGEDHDGRLPERAVAEHRDAERDEHGGAGEPAAAQVGHGGRDDGGGEQKGGERAGLHGGLEDVVVRGRGIDEAPRGLGGRQALQGLALRVQEGVTEAAEAVAERESARRRCERGSVDPGATCDRYAGGDVARDRVDVGARRGLRGGGDEDGEREGRAHRAEREPPASSVAEGHHDGERQRGERRAPGDARVGEVERDRLGEHEHRGDGERALPACARDDAAASIVSGKHSASSSPSQLGLPWPPWRSKPRPPRANAPRARSDAPPPTTAPARRAARTAPPRPSRAAAAARPAAAIQGARSSWPEGSPNAALRRERATNAAAASEASGKRSSGRGGRCSSTTSAPIAARATTSASARFGSAAAARGS